MAAQVDLSSPLDHCGTGVSDLRSGRSKICGALDGMASVFTSTRRTDRRSDMLPTFITAICYSGAVGKSTSK